MWLVTAGLGLGLGAIGRLVWQRIPTVRTRRLLRKVRVTPIAQLSGDVLACVVGKVELDAESLIAPLSRRTCVAYDDLVTENNADVYTVTHTVRRMVPFYVVDPTGRARVLAPEAALCNRPIVRTSSHVERIIEPGMTIRIVGSVILDPTFATQGERGYRDGAFRATLTGSKKYPLLIDVIST